MGWTAAKNGLALLSEIWMEERFNLLTTYCLPSLVHQKNKNFNWLVYFDTDTSEHFRKKIKQLEKNYAFFSARFVEHHDFFLTDLDQYIRSHKQPATTHVITTRLDSDDVLHELAVDKIQGCYQMQDFFVINFQTGYRFQASPVTRLTKKDWYNGPFISIIERITEKEAIQTGYAQCHDFYINDYSVHQISDQPYWVQVIHDSNHSSHIQGVPMNQLRLLTPFHIDTTGLKINFGNYIKERLFETAKKITPELIKSRLR